MGCSTVQGERMLCCDNKLHVPSGNFRLLSLFCVRALPFRTDHFSAFKGTLLACCNTVKYIIRSYIIGTSRFVMELICVKKRSLWICMLVVGCVGEYDYTYSDRNDDGTIEYKTGWRKAKREFFKVELPLIAYPGESLLVLTSHLVRNQCLVLECVKFNFLHLHTHVL